MILLALACRVPDLSVVERRDLASRVPVAGPTTRFIAVGDTGNANRTQREVAAGMRAVCAARGCDFALLLGDNLYPAGMSSPEDPRMDEVFTEVYADLGLDFHAVLGNHDYGQRHLTDIAQHQIDWAARQPRFHMPAAFYRFDAGPDAFWALDTDAVFWTGVQPQGDWLDETLGASTARWKVAFAHHPYLSNGDHGNAGAYEGWSYLPYASGSAVRDLYVGHVVGRADLVLSGHDHNLQLLHADGTALVVSGAGSSTNGVIDRGNTPLLAENVPGFVWVELGDVLTVALHDASGASLGERRFVHAPGGAGVEPLSAP